MAESFKCPYCKRLGNDHEKWMLQHMPKCRADWIKLRQTERKKQGRPAMTAAEMAALRQQDVFKGFEESDDER